MKRILNGVTYNTDTSATVARYSWADTTESSLYPTIKDCVVYRTKGGAFFEVDSWGPAGQEKHLFTALSREDLEHRLMTQDNVEIVDNSILEDPPEASADDKDGVGVLLRLPGALKRRLDDKARSAGLSVNVYTLKCLERCMEQSA
jgi:hypothetical protein